MTDYLVVFVTVPSKEEGENIAKVLLEQRLCACVNVHNGLSSFFHWEGSISQENEVLLIIKTKTSLYEQLETSVKKHHSYTVPEIVAIPIKLASKSYTDWIDESVQTV